MLSKKISENDLAWPALALADWKDTCETLHMWTQIVGKVRMVLSPHVNHWWEVPLYVTARGLTTSPIPCGAGIFEIRFDFIDHKLDIESSWGVTRTLPLIPRSVADFYYTFMETLASLGIEVKIWPMPVEIPNPVRFDRDHTHASYDPEYANRFWRILVTADAILKEFRARFIGKDSPVHFFWGSFDLAVTRFSGRRAPDRSGAGPIESDAYSHEVSSAGFWPGTTGMIDAAFYSYSAPEPAGFSEFPIRPEKALYHPDLHEFVLPYADVRVSASPKAMLLEFLQSSYDAAASLGKWDREALERR
jgi:hypothetical protein